MITFSFHIWWKRLSGISYLRLYCLLRQATAGITSVLIWYDISGSFWNLTEHPLQQEFGLPPNLRELVGYATFPAGAQSFHRWSLRRVQILVTWLDVIQMPWLWTAFLFSCYDFRYQNFTHKSSKKDRAIGMHAKETSFGLEDRFPWDVFRYWPFEPFVWISVVFLVLERSLHLHCQALLVVSLRFSLPRSVKLCTLIDDIQTDGRIICLFPYFLSLSIKNWNLAILIGIRKDSTASYMHTMCCVSLTTSQLKVNMQQVA